MLVLVTVALGPEARRRVEERVQSLGGEVVFASDVKDVSVDPDVIFGPAPLEYIAARPKLRWVHAHSAGVDQYFGKQIPFPKHVKLTNSSGVYGPAGGEHVLAMMLYFARGFHVWSRYQREKAWVREIEHARLLKGQTVCVLGLGDLGRHVVARAKAFEMRIIGVKRHPGPVEGVERVYPPEALDEALPQAQHLVITLPLTRETRGLIDARRIQLLPKGAYLYNIGRGAVVDQAALVEALRSGHLAGAGLDVFAEEPLPPDDPLWSMENVIITPHIGADTPWDNDRAAEIFIENLGRFAAGEPLINEVDLELGY